jgi:hypothetical protein
MNTILMVMLICPWMTVPFIIANDLDPIPFNLHGLFRPSWDRYLLTNILLYSFRAILCLTLFIETSRSLAIFLIPAGFPLKIRQYCINSLTFKAQKTFRSYSSFLWDFVVYNRILIISKIAMSSFGQLLSVYLALDFVVIIDFGYALIVLHQAFPLHLYLLICGSYGLALQIPLWGMKNEASCFESSKTVLRSWSCLVLVYPRKKLLKRIVKGLAPLKCHGQIADVNLFYFKRSTIVTFLWTMFIHTVNAVLSFPIKK